MAIKELFMEPSHCFWGEDLYCDDLYDGSITVTKCHRAGCSDECKGTDNCEYYVPYDTFKTEAKLEDMTDFGESKDMVNHPSHYCQGGIECIRAIEASMSPAGFQDYCKGNVMKYIWRWREKNGVEDLKKASVYLNWMIESAEKDN